MATTLASILAAGDGFGFIIVIAVIGGVIALIAWGAHSQKKIRENWALFARKNGLQSQGNANRPTIQGWMGPVYITLNTVVRGSGKNRTTYTQHHCTINAPMPGGIVLYKEGFFSKVGKVFGGQDVQIGDAALDNAFVIKAQDLGGTHALLSLPPVKKALLYVIHRHPGLRVQDRQLLVEHSGMTGDINKIEGVFADLSYLSQTFDAAYQELSGASATPQKVPTGKTRSAPKMKPQAQSSHAAAAEILGAALLDKSGFGQPQVRQAKGDEDPAKRKALSEMASALHQYEDKLATGKATPEERDASSYGTSKPINEEDAFASPKLEDAFADPKLNDDFSNAAWSRNDASTAFDSAATEQDSGQSSFDTFDAEPARKGKAGPVAKSLDALVAQLSDGALMSSAREAIIADNAGTEWPLDLIVDRIDSSWGFDLPESMRDGKTVECKDKNGAAFAVRFPKSRNSEIGNLKSGQTLKARGKLAAWDDLFKKATLDVE